MAPERKGGRGGHGTRDQNCVSEDQPSAVKHNGMNRRMLAGKLCAYAYNEWVGKWPSRTLREVFLRRWLGRFGANCGVQMGCRFLNGRKVFLGDNTVINFGCTLDGRKYAVRTGSHVDIGPEATILTLGHDPHSAEFADRGGEVVIGDRAWVCYRAIVLPGVKIGEGAVIGAGAVVSRDVEPYTVVAGNPARPVGQRQTGSGDRKFTYELYYRPWLL